MRASRASARMESISGLTSSTRMVSTHTLDPTPDAPRSYNILPIRLLKKDEQKLPDYSSDVLKKFRLV